jgi:hypothetical protein
MIMILLLAAIIQLAGGLLFLAVPYASSHQIEFMALACTSLLTFGLSEVVDALLDL